MNEEQSKENAAIQMGDEPVVEGSDKEQPKTPKTKVKMQSTYALPASSAEALSKILKAYVIASKQGEVPVKYSDVAAVSGVSPATVSRNNSFLSESGFIASDRYGYYKPSPDTTQFAKQAPWDESGAKQFIRRQIDHTWYGETIRQLFQMHNTLTKSQQIKALGIKSAPDQSDASKLELLFDFLVYFDYVVPDDEGNYSLRQAEAAESKDAVDGMIEAVMAAESPIAGSLGEPTGGTQPGLLLPHVNLNINLTPATTDEELEALVKKVKFLLDSLRRETS